MDSNICKICAEKYTECVRKKILCEHCKYEFCVGCFRKYLSMENTTEVDCPKCHVIFTDEFIYNNFSRNYIDNDIKKKRQDILLDKERALIPETVQYLDNISQAKQIKLETKEQQQQVWTLKRHKSQLNARYE